MTQQSSELLWQCAPRHLKNVRVGSWQEIPFQVERLLVDDPSLEAIEFRVHSEDREDVPHFQITPRDPPGLEDWWNLLTTLAGWRWMRMNRVLPGLWVGHPQWEHSLAFPIFHLIRWAADPQRREALLQMAELEYLFLLADKNSISRNDLEGLFRLAQLSGWSHLKTMDDIRRVLRARESDSSHWGRLFLPPGEPHYQSDAVLTLNYLLHPERTWIWLRDSTLECLMSLHTAYAIPAQLLLGQQFLLPVTQHPRTLLPSLIPDLPHTRPWVKVDNSSPPSSVAWRMQSMTLRDPDLLPGDDLEILHAQDDQWVLPVTRYGLGTSGMFWPAALSSTEDSESDLESRVKCGRFYFLELRSPVGLSVRSWESFPTKITAALNLRGRLQDQLFQLSDDDDDDDDKLRREKMEDLIDSLEEELIEVSQSVTLLFLFSWAQAQPTLLVQFEALQELVDILDDADVFDKFVFRDLPLIRTSEMTMHSASLSPLILQLFEMWEVLSELDDPNDQADDFDEERENDLRDHLFALLQDFSRIFDPNFRGELTFPLHPVSLISSTTGEYLGNRIYAMEDGLDQPICKTMRLLNLDAITFLSVPGQWRTVAEVLDSRADSFDHLVNLDLSSFPSLQ